MGEFPSAHFKTKTTKEMKSIGRKGGSVQSDRKKYAAKVREMKKRAAAGKITQKEVDWFMDTMEKPEANILEIKQYLEEIQKMCTKPNQAILLAQTQIQLHKAHFGDKHINQNINVNMTIEDWEKRFHDE